jgi:hypothetical protein
MVQTFHMDLRKLGFTPPYRLPDTKEGRQAFGLPSSDLSK